MIAPDRKVNRHLLAAILGVSLLWSPSALIASNVSLPNFSLMDTQGKAWHLSEYDGQPKLIMFWATWCEHCKKLFPTIQSLHDRYGSTGLKVVAISVYDDGNTTEYRARYGLTMDVLNDGDALVEQLQIPGTPTVIVLDGQNQIVFGAVSPDPLDTKLERAIQHHANSEKTTN